MQSRSCGWTLFAGVTITSFALLSFSGCASMIKGSAPQQVSFKTAPSDADCQVTDLSTGGIILKQKSPILTQLKRHSGYFKKAQYRYTCEKEGYKPNQVDIASSANGWYLGGNLIFGGLIGWLIVDPSTGAMWSFASDDITLAMKLASASAEEERAGLVPASYFQGIWVGTWQNPGWGQGQDVEITVGRRNPDGTFDTEYSWGWRSARAGEVDIAPGTAKVKGREDGERFVFEFDNPDSLKVNYVEMTKHEGEKLKIKMGGVMYPPSGYLKRK